MIFVGYIGEEHQKYEDPIFLNEILKDSITKRDEYHLTIVVY